MQGVWFDIAHNGCGLFIINDNGLLKVGYFGHKEDPEQMHLVGFGLDAARIPLILATGEGFPTNRETVQNHDAGWMSLEMRGMVLHVEMHVKNALLKDVDFSPPPPEFRKIMLDLVRL